MRRMRWAGRTIGSLGLFAMALAACGGGSSSLTAPTTTPATTPPPAVAAADVTITINGESGNMSFSPNPVTAKVGQTVAWRNGDNEHHTATANSGTFDTGSIAGGTTSKPITVTAVGSWDYYCRIHPSMVGTLTVTQ